MVDRFLEACLCFRKEGTKDDNDAGLGCVSVRVEIFPSSRIGVSEACGVERSIGMCSWRANDR
jgi:hypothetical protein